MTLDEQIAAKLATLNAPGQVQGRSGVRWGYDPQKRAWYTEGDALARKAGGRYYQNTTMGIPESVAGEGRVVSADGGVLVPTGGGGLLHGNARWSNKDAKFYSPFSWDKLALYGTLGALTAGTANAAMAGAAGTAATSGAATTGLTTGAVAPTMTPAAAALSGTVAVPGATGASMAGRRGILGVLGKIFGAGDRASRVLDVGRLVAGGASAAAQNRQQQAQILASLYNTQANIAKQQTDAAREAQRMEIARAQMSRQMDLTAPTLTAPSFLQGRMGSIQMPTLPAASRENVLSRLSAPIPAYRPPAAPALGASGAEQGLGAAGLILQLLGAGYGGADQSRQQPRRVAMGDGTPDVTSPVIPPVMGGYSF